MASVIAEPNAVGPAGKARPFKLREMLEILFRDRWRIGAAFAISFGIVLIAALLVPSRYPSDARLLVRLGHEYVYVAEPSRSGGGAMPVWFSRDEALNAETEILSSGDVVRGAIARVGIARLYPSLAKGRNDPKRPKIDQAVDKFRRAFSAELVKDSTVLRLSFSHPDPEVAQQALQALTETYLDRRRGVFSDAHVKFIGEQAAQAAQRLAAAEQRLAAFKREHGIVNYEQQVTLLLQQGNQLELQLNDSGSQVEIARARADKLRQLTKATPVNLVVYSETLGDPQTPKQLLDLRLKEQGLSSRYLESNPLVLNARKDVVEAERFLTEQRRNPPRNVRTARNQVLDQAQLDLMRASSDESALVGGRDALQVRLQEIQQRVAALSEQQSRFNALELERKLMEESYGNYAMKLEGARIDEAREQKERTNVSVLQAASRPLSSTSVRRPLLLIGLVFSLGIALLVALLSEALRSGFQLPEQMERKLGIPVLASLPGMGR